MDGMYTKPIQGGVLGGGYRSELAQCNPAIEQKPETVAQILISAESILEKNVQIATMLGDKFVGPRPSRETEADHMMTGLMGCAQRIRRLANEISDELSRSHEVIGG